MKKLLLLLCFFAGFTVTQAQEQYNDSKGFKAGFAAGFLSEIESVGGSAAQTQSYLNYRSNFFMLFFIYKYATKIHYL